MARQAQINRETNETKIGLELNLDGQGQYQITTGVGYFDHMLSHLAKHALLDLNLTAQGDLEVDAHHTVEDVGIVLGTALRQAMGDRSGITRYGSEILPMDDALVMVAVDLGGRPYLGYQADLGTGDLGGFDLELVEEFFRALATNGGMNIHIRLLAGKNRHHCLEAIFKAFGRSLRKALELDPRVTGVPSTKGIL
ncbi:MAG TPA: imidazoleglycerol-phosphate dehydratase HisB [Firmicutes bacterium]|jgi:imidazoleglycerol-phosphate dehydratase|nr:imidazoleglycerol-phosphate dehydratase HisB [Bacillota bacterium]HOQ24944.1 imidazoleglycerol-phosphate dehydratase HisB [Bacillota bacterium]HPT68135.1 imidazoleglycerol-phosphate dehydratase HisB [Bacillota bacterium]